MTVTRLAEDGSGVAITTADGQRIRASAVVGADGQLHGVEGLYVADASIMPAVTSGNTNMPVTVIGERIARSLLGVGRP